MCGGFGSLDRDANFTRLNAALDVSIWHFQRSFYTCSAPFWPTPVPRRCTLVDSRVWRLWHCWRRCEFESNDSRYHKTYQYGAFGEAFIHAEPYSGQPRCPDNASLRIEGYRLELALRWRCKWEAIESTLEPVNNLKAL
jgi:hypothetical protein